MRPMRDRLLRIDEAATSEQESVVICRSRAHRLFVTRGGMSPTSKCWMVECWPTAAESMLRKRGDEYDKGYNLIVGLVGVGSKCWLSWESMSRIVN